MKKAINIKWDTDGQVIDLPTEVELPAGVADCECGEDDFNCENNTESVNNYLSDKYGWCVENYTIINIPIYFRIIGENGTYILTKEEMDLALDRENEGVKGEVLSEQQYQ